MQDDPAVKQAHTFSCSRPIGMPIEAPSADPSTMLRASGTLAFTLRCTAGQQGRERCAEHGSAAVAQQPPVRSAVGVHSTRSLAGEEPTPTQHAHPKLSPHVKRQTGRPPPCRHARCPESLAGCGTRRSASAGNAGSIQASAVQRSGYAECVCGMLMLLVWLQTIWLPERTTPHDGCSHVPTFTA